MYLLSFKLALIAYVYSVILTEDEMILNKLYIYLGQSNLPDWLFKPLIGCFRCVAGQFGLWGYLIINFRDYNVFDHLFTIMFTIFISIILNKIYGWLES